MRGVAMKKRYWQDWANALIGVWIFASSWVLANNAVSGVQGGGSLPAWNLWIVGALVAVLAMSARLRFSVWEEWANSALGVSLVVSALFWSGEKSAALVWSTFISGLLITAFAGWAAGDAHNLLPKRILAKGDLREGLPELALPDES